MCPTWASPSSRASRPSSKWTPTCLSPGLSTTSLSLAAAGIEPVALGLPSPKEVAEAYLHATLMGETDLVAACASSEPLDELDDAFARIEYKLVAQSA